jgi:hypothetical protein
MAPKIAHKKAVRDDEPRRRLRKQTTEDIAMKACRDNFIKKGMCEEEVFSLKVDDKSLYDDVVDELRRKRHDFTFVMGSIYYREKRDKFRSPTHPMNSLKSPAGAAADVVAPTLIKAMVAHKKNKNDNQHFVLYLGTVANINMTELCGVCRWALGLNCNNDKQLPACIAFLKFVARKDLVRLRPQQLVHLDAWMDNTLIAMKKSCKKTDAVAFVTVNKDVICSVMDRTDLDKVKPLGGGRNPKLLTFGDGVRGG